MMIKDLEPGRELSAEERAAVEGGAATNNVAAMMAGSALANGGGGVSIGSPVIQVNPQIQTIVPTATDLNLDLNVANIVASATTGLIQG
ncbi:MAG: hypothetical protein U1E89_03915 [Burkholderiaceae bacterium]